MAELTQGMKVRSSDGENLGKIIRIDPEAFLVEKGLFFPKDYSIPLALVREVRGDEVWLAATRAELEREGTFREETGAGPGYAEGGRYREGEERLTLSEEELEARKRVRDAGDVTIRKDVVTEHRQIDVPVTKEEVRVERVPASEASAPGDDAFREKTISVPVREEEIEVTKKPRVREEVRVTKTARQEERRVEGDVRREEARVEGVETEPGTGRGYPPDDER